MFEEKEIETVIYDTKGEEYALTLSHKEAKEVIKHLINEL